MTDERKKVRMKKKEGRKEGALVNTVTNYAETRFSFFQNREGAELRKELGGFGRLVLQGVGAPLLLQDRDNRLGHGKRKLAPRGFLASMG